MKPLHAGMITKVIAGKYAGHPCQVRKINEKTVEVMISGRIVKLAKERVEHG